MFGLMKYDVNGTESVYIIYSYTAGDGSTADNMRQALSIVGIEHNRFYIGDIIRVTDTPILPSDILQSINMLGITCELYTVEL